MYNNPLQEALQQLNKMGQTNKSTKKNSLKETYTFGDAIDDIAPIRFETDWKTTMGTKLCPDIIKGMENYLNSHIFSWDGEDTYYYKDDTLNDMSETTKYFVKKVVPAQIVIAHPEKIVFGPSIGGSLVTIKWYGIDENDDIRVHRFATNFHLHEWFKTNPLKRDTPFEEVINYFHSAEPDRSLDIEARTRAIGAVYPDEVGEITISGPLQDELKKEIATRKANFDAEIKRQEEEEKAEAEEKAVEKAKKSGYAV